MNLDHLRYFLEAARLEHFGKAAKALGISPSAISHGIADLEEKLGRELFIRQGKNVYVTPHGKAFAEKLRGALDQLSAVQEEARSESVGLVGHFRIGATHALCSRFLTPVWARLQHENPRLTSELYTLRSGDVVARVMSGELDFGICVNPQANPGVDSSPLRSGTCWFAVRRGHPILKLTPARQIKALSNYPAVLPRALQGIELCDSQHPMFKRYQVVPRFDCIVDSYDVASRKLESSDSWCFLPDWLIAESDGSLRPIQHPEDWHAPSVITAVWPHARALPRPLALLRERLVKSSETDFPSAKKRLPHPTRKIPQMHTEMVETAERP